jgi:hypothetical protein
VITSIFSSPLNVMFPCLRQAGCVKAAECFSETGPVITHDSFNRFLTRQSLVPETLWEEVEPFVEKRSG